MIDLATLLAFIVTAAVLVASPGPSVLFVIARSINLGPKGGLLSVIGVACGALCHALAVSLGLATVFQSSPYAFTIVKNLGCLYLLYLGIRTFLAKPAVEEESAGPVSARDVIVQGWLVELLNPKTALFFLAFLPQFASPARGPIGSQLLVLGLTFVAVGLLSDGLYALAAGRFGNFLKRSRTFRRTERYFSGSVYCGLGLGGLFYRVSKSA